MERQNIKIHWDFLVLDDEGYLSIDASAHQTIVITNQDGELNSGFDRKA